MSVLSSSSQFPRAIQLLWCIFYTFSLRCGDFAPRPNPSFFSHACQTSHSLIQVLQLSSSYMGVSVLHFTQSLKVSVSVWFIWFYANLYTTQLIDSKELLLVEMPEHNSIASIMTLHLLHASSSSFISSDRTPSAGSSEKYMQISDNNVNIVDKDH